MSNKAADDIGVIDKKGYPYVRPLGAPYSGPACSIFDKYQIHVVSYQGHNNYLNNDLMLNVDNAIKGWR